MEKLRIEIKWALIFVAMGLLWMVLEKAVGLHSTHIDKHATYTNLVAIPAILIYVLALRDKRNNFYDGKMTYQQGFITGLIITVVVALIAPLSQYITNTVITPEYFPNVIAYAVESGMMEQEAAENYFTLKNYMIQAPIGALIMGVLTSAVVAIFIRKK